MTTRRPLRPARESQPLPSLTTLGAPLVLLAVAACQPSHAASVDLVREPDPATAPPAAPLAAPPAVAPPAPLPIAPSATTTVATAAPIMTPPHATGTKRRPQPVFTHAMMPGRMAVVHPWPAGGNATGSGGGASTALDPTF